jgi:hypothetical protein
MKKYIIISFLLLIFWVFPYKYTYAQNIQTGNVNSTSTIYTNITGDGNVKTHIETSVNGQTNIIDSNQPGRIEVINKNGNVTINKSPDISITVTPNKTATSSPIRTLKPKHNNYLYSSLRNFLDYLYKIFRII